jgi:hypothetical protein
MFLYTAFDLFTPKKDRDTLQNNTITTTNTATTTTTFSSSTIKDSHSIKTASNLYK